MTGLIHGADQILADDDGTDVRWEPETQKRNAETDRHY